MGNWVYLNVTIPEDLEASGRSDIEPPDTTEPIEQFVSEDNLLGLEGEEMKIYCIYGG